MEKSRKNVKAGNYTGYLRNKQRSEKLIHTSNIEKSTVRKYSVCTNGGLQLPKVSSSVVLHRLKVTTDQVNVAVNVQNPDAEDIEELINATGQTVAEND